MAENRILEVRTVAEVFLALATVATALRCYVRAVTVKAFGWDDAIMLLALGFFAMFSDCMIGGSRYGTGKHLTALSDHEKITAMEYWFLCDVAYCLSSILCKISIGIFLLHVTVNKNPSCCYLCSYRISGDLWDDVLDSPCAVYTGEVLLAAIRGVLIFDMTVRVLPVFVVRNLQMRRDLKYAVASVLGMARIASVAVLVRLAYVKTLRNPNFLYATVGIAVWSNVETGLGILAGSLATLRHLPRMLRPGTGRSYHNDHTLNLRSRIWHRASDQRNNALKQRPTTIIAHVS
ncbi:hypothetical protein ETB97_003560 [Aspergillus alliaceus]|uniref:Rhodopsin domain-containing protein n=1 Tax=Petromyces alliaceus TaxID=209559 RepID=A0A8H6A143_PETAA|nr:hypothetical protein ETB97_003560 [Aspergillus burnettii]